MTVCAVGRARGGAEAELVGDYLRRAGRTGAPIGIGPVDLVEVDDRSGRGAAGEAARLRRAVPRGAVLCAMDERGRRLDSPGFARLLADWRDAGRPAVAFLLGGADGLDDGLRTEAATVVSFGAMVWPHMLARVMLAEQIYRATSILVGSPYHRA